MKFKRIKLHNFMRYKGDAVLNFSCDEAKNVTVVLGNNMFGKTTLAQAFRWGLFEQLASTNYSKKGDIVLLNHEVIASMTPGARQEVSVEITVEDNEDIITFTRRAYFRRKNTEPNILAVAQDGETSLTMLVVHKGIPGIVVNNNGENREKTQKRGCVQDRINSMLPEYLSNYFFFDGERWSDGKASRAEVKQAIETILGVTGYITLKRHLKEDPYNNVIKTLRGRIKGSSDEYQRIEEEMHSLQKEIEKLSDEEADLKGCISIAEERRDNLQQQLDEFRDDEQQLRDFKTAEDRIKVLEKMNREQYAEIIRDFCRPGTGAARFFAAELLPEVAELLKQVDLSGKDIPGVTSDTVDYLLKEGTCICGTPLDEGSDAHRYMLNLKKQIPPEMIGGAAGKLQELLAGWKADCNTLVEEIESRANEFDDTNYELSDRIRERDRISRSLNKNVDIAAIRRNLNDVRSRLNDYIRKQTSIRQKIEYYQNTLDQKSKLLESLAQQDESNRKVKCAIAYAEELYKVAERYAHRAQEGIFEELNSIIEKNFSIMFHDGEKYAQLEGDYRVHVYYRNSGQEELSLSNGEATAINFVYIVSILELAKKRALEGDDVDEETAIQGLSSGIIQLPLVLDGPFSTLSNENTHMVAQKLPEFAEQVIIFMLDKDWESSGLEKFTDNTYCYHIHKDERSASSSLAKDGEM